MRLRVNGCDAGPDALAQTGKPGGRTGIALIATLGILLVVGLLVLASAVSGLFDRSISAGQFRSNAAYYAAQSGLDVVKTAIFLQLVDRWEDTGVGWCESPLADGVSGSDGEIVLVPGGPPLVGALGLGTYSVSLELINDLIVLTSVGVVGNGQATVQLVTYPGGGPGSAWDNAILARSAEGGTKAIAGNVAVYGAIHVVGDVDSTYDPDEVPPTTQEAFTLGGGTGVFNSYFGPPNSGQVGDVYPEVAALVQNANVDLCARIKVAEGHVFLDSGAVYLGTEEHPLESIHLGVGDVCTARTRNPRPGQSLCRTALQDADDSNRVFVKLPEDGGIKMPYAPFAETDIPLLSTISRYTPTMVEGAIVDGCDWLYDPSGVIVLPPADSADDSTQCGVGVNSVRWSGGNPGYLEISGDIQLVGLDSSTLRVDSPVFYSGKGTLLVGSGVDDTSAEVVFGNHGTIRPLSANTYLTPGVGGNALAVLSTGDISVGGTAAVDPFAALLYAQGTFSASKQTTVVGAVIAERFDLTQQVSRIAYHPDVRFAAEELCLPGTACAEGGTPQLRGALADIAYERR